MKNIEVITIGGATRDITFFTDLGLILPWKEATRQKLIAFEYGAKIGIKKAYFTFGGGANNTCVALNRLGIKTAPIIRVGNDRDGEAILENLKRNGISTKFVQIDKKEATGFSFIILTKRRYPDRTIFLYRGANDNLEVKNLKSKIKNLKWIYVLSLTGKKWKEILNQVFEIKQSLSNINFAWNPGGTQLKAGYKELKKFLKVCDLLFLNRDEAIELANSRLKDINSLLKTISDWGPKILCITHGRRGAHVFTRGIKYYSRIYPQKIVDTTGAGDAWGASFLAGLIFYNDIKKALKMAMINSASVVGQIGAQNGLLTKKEIEKLL